MTTVLDAANVIMRLPFIKWTILIANIHHHPHLHTLAFDVLYRLMLLLVPQCSPEMKKTDLYRVTLVRLDLLHLKWRLSFSSGLRMAPDSHTTTLWVSLKCVLSVVIIFFAVFLVLM